MLILSVFFLWNEKGKAQQTISGKIEAESFTGGGVGTGITNNSSFSGGKAVNNFAPGNSLTFSVNVSTTGTYSIELRAGTMNYGSAKVKFSGNSSSTNFSINPTGGYSTMASITVNNVSLVAGTQTMTVENVSNYWDVDYINVTSGTPVPDTQAPSVPSGLASAGITTTNFSLSWAASSDNVGVTKYEVFKNGTSIGTTTSTSISVSGLSCATTYSMTVKAGDAAGNYSAASTSLNVLTSTCPDIQAPSAPTNLASSNISNTTFSLSWTASTDNIGVTKYEVFKNGTSIGTTTSTSMSVTGLTAATTYSMTVKAIDAAANSSIASTALSVTTTNTQGGTSVPGKIEAESFTIAGSGTSISSNAAFSGGKSVSNFAPGSSIGFNINVASEGNYNIELRAAGSNYGSAKLTFSGNSASATISTTPTANYSTFASFTYLNIALSAGSQTLTLTNQFNYWDVDYISVTANGPDTQAPSIPSGLTSSNISSTGFTLSWTASTDNVGVSKYEVFKNGTSIGTTTSTSISVSDLSASTAYTMTVKAGDAAGNMSTASSALIVTTSDSPDILSPSTPSNLVASAITKTSFTLAWTASTDNVGVTKYEVFKAGTSIGTTTSTTINVTGLTAGTTYAMTVKASDAAGNTSAASTPITVTTSQNDPSPTLNGDFENDLIGWTSDGNVAITTSAANVHGGSKALSHTIGKGGVHLSSNIPLGSNNLIEIKAWVKRSGSYWCGFGLDLVDANGTVLSNGKIVFNVGSSVTTYTEFKQSMNIPSGAVAARIWTWKDDSTATFFLDDISLTLSQDNQAPSAPANLVASNVSCTTVNLSWNASSDNVGVTYYNIYNGSTLLMSAGNVTSTTLSELIKNTSYNITVKAVDQVGNISTASNSVSFTTTNSECGPDFIGKGYDIGAVGVTGREQIDLGTGKYLIWGGGNEVDNALGNGDNDAIHYYAIKASGDFQMTARVVDVDQTNYHSRAGVMVRGTLDANSRNGFMCIAKGQPYYQWCYRWYNGGPGKTGNTMACALPYWVRIVKTDDAVSGWYSTDGVNWLNDWSSENIYVEKDTIYVGLAVCSYNTGTAARAEFDNVKFEQLTFNQPAYTSKPNIKRNIGTNLWYIYSVDAQKDPAVWTGGNVWNKANPDFTQADPWDHVFVNNLKIYSTIRFMDWAATNGSTAKEWTNRTLKTDPYQGSWESGTDQPRGVKTVGVAWDWMIDLCNRAGSNIWVNIPHLTIDPDDFPNGTDYLNEYVYKLAILIKTGVDMKGVNLKDKVGGAANLNQLGSKTAQDFINMGGIKTTDPLASNLKVYIEYSNELWMRGQHDYLVAKGSTLGLGWEKVGAWCEVRMWNAFKDVFGSDASSRIVNIAGSIVNFDMTSISGIFADIYNNTSSNRNSWGIKPSFWKIPTYVPVGYFTGVGEIYGNNPDIENYWKNEVDFMVTDETNFKNSMWNTYQIPLISYEGGHHIGRYQGEFNVNPKSYDMYLYWLDKIGTISNEICHYTHYGKIVMRQETIYGNWGAMAYDRQPIDKAHKYRALRDWALGNAGTAPFKNEEDFAVSSSNSNSFNIKVYPNPASSENITLEIPKSESSKVLITDITGKIVFETLTTSNQVDLSNQLKAGIYLISVKSDNNRAFSKLIIK